MNHGLGKLDRWTEDSTKQCAAGFAGRAVGVWDAPPMSADVVDAYKSKAKISGHISEQHPHLVNRPMREVFEAFRKQVLGLAPWLTEEVLKRYEVYKAETNFVDVVPQAKRLRQSLNMAFSEISDPKRICKDISGLGRWGNGDVEVWLTSVDELPDVMGLVRQSFEK